MTITKDVEFHRRLEVEQSTSRVRTAGNPAACARQRAHVLTNALACCRVTADLLSGVDNPMNVEYIEELIFRQEPFQRVMRLLCLLSMTTGGLKPKVLENFRREIIQVPCQTHGAAELGRNLTYGVVAACVFFLPAPDLRLRQDLYAQQPGKGRHAQEGGAAQQLPRDPQGP